MNKKKIAVLMAVMLLIGVASGATIAWLAAGTDPVTNTFTVGNINLEMYEKEGTEKVDGKEYHVVPGDDLVKDPTVLVKGGSEDCYVFVRMDVTGNPYINDTKNTNKDHILNWVMDVEADLTAAGWHFLDLNNKVGLTSVADYLGDDTTGAKTVYLYRVHEKTAKDVEYTVIKDNAVRVSEFVTKEMVDKGIDPVITFKAAAVQTKNLSDKDPEKTALENIIPELPVKFTSKLS